jgi:hypothetical protein
VPSEHEADTIVVALRSQGLRARSVAVIPLRRQDGIEQHPVARWAVIRASRDALRAMLWSLPLLAIGYVGLLWLGLDENPSLTVAIGLVGAFGAAPIAGLIAFAHGWSRWSPLTVLDDTDLGVSGFVVVATGVRDQITSPAVPEQVRVDVSALTASVRRA